MRADEARRLSEDSIKGPATDHLVNIVLDKIKQAATNGNREISEPFAGLRMTSPTHDQLKALWPRIENMGYTVTHHPDPDPGNPCSRPYTSVSW